jgi:23S rRNA (adenine2503-C2)-methyltransferase
MIVCLQLKLAVSLHQASNSARSALMPVNDKYPIEDLLDACVQYIEKTNRRISFEWALIRGVTDTPAAAHDLGELLKGMLCHVNLIPLNATKEYAGGPSTREAAAVFVSTLARFGVTATIRVHRGTVTLLVVCCQAIIYTVYYIRTAPYILDGLR